MHTVNYLANQIKVYRTKKLVQRPMDLFLVIPPIFISASNTHAIGTDCVILL
jgi:hypothetical protein